MLTYDEQYDINQGLFMTFNGNNNKKYYSVRHGKKRRDEMIVMFPHSKWSSYSRDVIILVNLYINFVKMPSSATAAADLLNEVSIKDVYKFKDEIIQYKHYIHEDVESLIIKYGNNVTLAEVTHEYSANAIKWYTYYFYLLSSGANQEKILKSRVNGILLQRIKNLLLFVSFSQEGMGIVEAIITENIRI